MSEEYTTVFPPYYEGAEMFRGNAGWENPPYYLTAYGLAVKHGYVGTEEEWLASLKGDPGPGIVILGHYDTLAELEEAVTEPDDGDFYEVGSGDNQVIYYYSAVQEDWMPVSVKGPQGDPGPAGQDGAHGVDGADGKSAYEQAQDAGYSGTEQEFMSLLAALPGYTEQARLWAVTAGEAETAAEGYAEAAAESAEEAAAAAANVPDPYDSTPAMDGTADAGSSDKWARGDHVHPSDTGRQEKITASGILKGNGSGGVSAAVAGADYQAPIDTGTMALSSTWTGSGPWTQVATITGATVTANSKVDLQPTAAQLSALIADGVTALVAENVSGTVTVTAFGAAPSTSLSLQITVTEVA